MRRSALVGAVAVCGLAAVVAARVQAAGAASGPSFTNFAVSSVPGTVCPGGNPCSNPAAEPALRADGDGNFFASSENGLGGGTEAWRSLDGGVHYQALISPNQGSAANETGFAPGGGDTDVAVAPVRNLQGNFNVYVASLTLANVDVSTSTDKGATWSLNAVTTPETIDDREWIAADGMQNVCISYHNAVQGITVGCSTNAGVTFTQWTPAFDVNHQWQTANNMIGNLAIDPTSHVMYQAYTSIASSSEVVNGTVNSNYHSVWVAVSTNGGASFTDYPIYVNPNTKVQYGSQFPSVAVDSAGNVYTVFSDGHHVYEAYSKDHGRTWSAPVRVDKAGTAIEPWVVAGAAGKIDVVYYKTAYADPSTTADNYPSTAAWTVGFAQNLNAASDGSFGETTATPIVHYGGVCLSGIACTGNRDLYDDFQVAASPKTGLASIVYSDDQYAANGQSSPYCTSQADSNSGNCDHTAVATQTSGSGIYAAKK
jgi:hypothetical protein